MDESLINNSRSHSPDFGFSFFGIDGVWIPDVVRPPPGVVVVGREARLQDAERQLEGDDGFRRRRCRGRGRDEVLQLDPLGGRC